jgi:hypothetical protein
MFSCGKEKKQMILLPESFKLFTLYFSIIANRLSIGKQAF